MPAAERPSERRSATRTAVVWDALAPVLDQGPLDVLDIGGGTGGSAVVISERGHRVTVVDPSPDALASLGRRARERGVSVNGVQGDLASTVEVVGPDGADLVLCHGVLEVVDDPQAALHTLRRVVRPGGALSLLVAQRHAAVVARAMAGHFAAARDLLGPPDAAGGAAGGSVGGSVVGSVVPRAERGGRRFTHGEVDALLADAGFEQRDVQAVRVFVDLVPGSLLDAEPGATGALLDLERAVAARPEYLPLATQLHLLAR